MGNDNHVVVSHKLCGFQGRMGGRVVMMKEQCGACSNFLLRSPANSITEPSGVCKLMDCSVTDFMDEFSNIFNIFCHSGGAWSP
jgi:hypothetical protein